MTYNKYMFIQLTFYVIITKNSLWQNAIFYYYFLYKNKCKINSIKKKGKNK